MRVWLLQSRRGGRTCGHLHVRESGAWRCMDTQPDPSGWSVVSTWLSDPEGARSKVELRWLMVVAGFLVLIGGVVVTALVGMVWTWIAGYVWMAVGVAVVVVVFGLSAAGPGSEDRSSPPCLTYHLRKHVSWAILRRKNQAPLAFFCLKSFHSGLPAGLRSIHAVARMWVQIPEEN